jgi:membrane protease YdiL (CAAX protease family)
MVLALATYLFGSSGIEVPIPILKAMSLPVFISAACFGITHFQYFGFKATEATINKVLFAFVFGLFVGNIVAISGSILYGIAFHIIANSGATLFYLKNSKAKQIEISRR